MKNGKIGRSAKAVGAMITDQIKSSVDTLLHLGTLIGLAWVGVWLFTAVYVGNKFTILAAEKENNDRIEMENKSKLVSEESEIQTEREEKTNEEN